MLYVVVPVYNAKKYLQTAVDSVLKQPSEDIEVVLVDDGSTDGSGDLCNAIAEKYQAVYSIHQENAGVSAARNAGIEYALSSALADDYIAFLDADDAWTASFFDEGTVQLLQQKYDLIGFQSCNCDPKLRPYDVPESMGEGLHAGGQSSVWLHANQHFAAKLCSCEFLRKNNIRFFEGLKYSEDKIFSMQCMYLAESIYLENKLLYLHRNAGNSAMSRRKLGIPYYVPIIEGYIKLDVLMRLRSDNKPPLSESRLMASIYIMDMVEEHYALFRSKASMDALFDSHPNYISIVEATGEYADLKPNTAYTQYKKHPSRYIIQNNLYGGIKICKIIVRKILRLIK